MKHITVAIDLEDLAQSLGWEYEIEELVEFVIAIDETVVDLAFTIALRDRLNEIIARETD